MSKKTAHLDEMVKAVNTTPTRAKRLRHVYLHRRRPFWVVVFGTEDTGRKKNAQIKTDNG